MKQKENLNRILAEGFSFRWKTYDLGVFRKGDELLLYDFGTDEVFRRDEDCEDKLKGHYDYTEGGYIPKVR